MSWWRPNGSGPARRRSHRRRRRWALNFDAFKPSRADMAAYRKQVEAAMRQLAPDGVDEVTGHALDNLVNTWMAQLDNQLMIELAAYQPQVVYDLAAAHARLAGELLRHRHRLRRLDDLMVAWEAAASYLIGDPEQREARTKEGRGD